MAAALTPPARPPLKARITSAWRARADADPKFRQKLALEAALACALQTTAEVQRRGRAFGREADYVVAGVLTALAGKLVASFQAAPSTKAPRRRTRSSPDVPVRIASAPSCGRCRGCLAWASRRRRLATA